MLSEFNLSEEEICIDYELSFCDFQPAMNKLEDDNKLEDNKSVAAGWKCISNPGSGSEGTLSRGILIKLKPDNLKGVEKIHNDDEIFLLLTMDLLNVSFIGWFYTPYVGL